ncbi:hypothetical protein [Methylomonas albis]|uniref:RiboL-PSP-HEPN domain-containing protein n=1 Tax=Methylomonas albis TaxID=1854563 RepID=A0ABR9D2Q3_9GAMM|nr:hypothetical protein [Methylomonas albis]MBD9357389.1 hypothetical protein [Methylomonas albis]
MPLNEDKLYDIEEDSAMSDFMDEISDQAISEFKQDRLRSYYLDNSMVMRPAVDALQEGKRLLEDEYPSAALVFFGTSIELLLKATVLQPVVKGLVHSDVFAEIIMQHTLGQTGFDRYEKLLAVIFRELSGVELSSVKKNDVSESLLSECKSLQKVRNSIIHRGERCSQEAAKNGLDVAVAVYSQIVVPVLSSIQLTVIEKGEIVPKSSNLPSPF